MKLILTVPSNNFPTLEKNEWQKKNIKLKAQRYKTLLLFCINLVMLSVFFFAEFLCVCWLR